MYVGRICRGMARRGRNRAITGTSVQLAVAGIMFRSAYLVTTGLFGYTLAPANVMAFAFCMGMLARPIRGLARVYPQFMEAVAARVRLAGLLVSHWGEQAEAGKMISIITGGSIRRRGP